MGLTIHYAVHAPRCDLTQAKAFTRTLRRHAQSMQRRGEIDELLPCTDGPAELARWATCWKILELEIDPPASTGIAVAPLEGCIFPVLLGEGCEPLWLGLCRYPATITHDGRKVATKLGSGWQLRGSCKTQYASLHGWDYFRRSHVAAIALLRFCDRLGARVRIVDEGEWWPRQSDAALRRKVDKLNGIVAALAGAIKDASDDDAPGTPVASPIFAHPHFERLEAEGAARAGSAMSDAARLISNRHPPG